jgi:hypothetical protein
MAWPLCAAGDQPVFAPDYITWDALARVAIFSLARGALPTFESKRKTRAWCATSGLPMKAAYPTRSYAAFQQQATVADSPRALERVRGEIMPLALAKSLQ